MGERTRYVESFKRFQCSQCGKCCTLTVMPSQEDIKKIEMLGHKRMNFMRSGSFRKKKGLCFFAKKESDNKIHCSIHEMKPRICREYPFTVMKNDNLFSCPSLKG